SLHLLLLAAHAVQAVDVLADALLILAERVDIRFRAADLGVGPGDLALQRDDLLQLTPAGVGQSLVLEIAGQDVWRQILDRYRAVVHPLFVDRELLLRGGRQLDLETVRAGRG